MTQKHLTDQRFTDLELPPALQAGIDQAGFEFLTPIQARVLPILLEQRDVAGQAQTGTGKTAAFLIAMLNRLENFPSSEPAGPRALILAPTRELAIQIYKDAQILSSHLHYRLALAYGGTGYDTQRRQLEQGFDVLIGTPGRIIDYYKQGIFTLKSIEVMVLDEADRMFDLGFIRDIRYVLRRMPEPQKRLSMLFSATLSLRVNELAYEHMNNPESVKIESEFATVDAVEQRVYFPANDEKIPLLIALLKDVDPSRTLIFSNTKQTAELLGAWLTGNGFSAGVLSGDVPQKKRERLLQQFKQGDIAVLVATDVAARGLHIPNVSHVINFDLPQDAEDYVHRVGRTARAGARGDAISFACETHAFSLADIEQFIGHKVAVASFDSGALAVPDPPVPLADRKRTRGSSGKDRAKDRRPEKHARSTENKAGENRKSRQTREPKQVTESPEPSAQTPPGQRNRPPSREPVRDQSAEPASDSQSGTRRREIPAIG